jgi:hypothetical protein
MIEHKTLLLSGTIVVLQTSPKDTGQDCKNSDRKGTNGQHTGKEKDNVRSAPFMPSGRARVNPNPP